MDWKQEIRLLKLNHIKQVSPGFFELSGGYQMKTMPYKADTVTRFENCILSWIKLNGGVANRIATSKVYKERIQLAGGNHRDILRLPSGSIKGQPSIQALIKGRHVSIEIRMSEESNIIHADNRDANALSKGWYYVARNMPDFVTWYKDSFEKNTSLINPLIK